MNNKIKLPSWLPPIIDINKYSSIIDFINDIYTIFENDFKDPNNPIMFNGKIVKYALVYTYQKCDKLQQQGFNNCDNMAFNCKNCPYVGKEDIFNHITTKDFKKDSKNQIRTPGIFQEERAVRIHWIKHIIQNYQQPEVFYYNEFDEATNSYNHCFWLKNQKYFVVVREEHNGRLFLTSAYYLFNRDATSRIRLGYKKYKKFILTKKTPSIKV